MALKINNMPLWRQNALCPRAWKVVLEPSILINWNKLDEKDISYWSNLYTEEVIN